MKYSKKLVLLFFITTATSLMGMKTTRPPLKRNATGKRLSKIVEKFYLAIGPKCERTMTIIDFLKIEQERNKKVLAFNYGKPILETPGGTTFSAIKIYHALSIQHHIDVSKDVNVVAIDGAEKFSDSLVRVISNLGQQGMSIYVAFSEKENPSLKKKLMRIAKNKHILQPKCITCHEKIPYSYYDENKKRQRSHFTMVDWYTEDKELDKPKRKIKEYLAQHNCAKKNE